MPLYLNGTTGVSGVDGTTSSPALQGNDTNTGIVFGTDTISLVEGGTAALSIDSSANASLVGTLAMGSSFLRNRIINGDMRIDQRATAVSGASAGFTVDRWQFDKSNDATESCSQNSDAPSGFSYSLRNTISVGDATIGATQYSQIQQPIEGFNIADLEFGTSNARSVTVSFWVKSTVTGQYTANIRNSAPTRICPFSYTISATNTWEYKTVTLPGCPDGSWNTTNGVGIRISFYPALGSSYLGGTSGAWNNGTSYGSGSPVNGIASNGNIFAITGVQLEVGSVATPFERRQYGTELVLCQRYYETSGDYQLFSGYVINGDVYYNPVRYQVVKRAVPSSVAFTDAGNNGFPAGAPTLGTSQVSGFYCQKVCNGTRNSGYFQYSWTSTAEL